MNETNKKKRANGWIIFALFFSAIIAISYKPSVEAIYCNAKTLATKPDVIMLATSWCPYCSQARKYFVNNEISYCEYNIEDNGEGARMYDQVNTNPSMPIGIPVLFIGEYQFSGFDEHRIGQLITDSKAP